MEQSKTQDRKIDMDSAEWLVLDMRPGQTFLSTRPFNCPVCGWKSDKWLMSSKPHSEPHLICPNDHLPRYLRVLH
jgi:hypothetical protein